MAKYIWRDGHWRDPVTGKAMATAARICMPMIQSDYEAYYSPASSKMIEGRRAHRDDLARTGCRLMDSSEGPKTCRTEKWARRLGLEHDPDTGKLQHALTITDPAPFVRGKPDA